MTHSDQCIYQVIKHTDAPYESYDFDVVFNTLSRDTAVTEAKRLLKANMTDGAGIPVFERLWNWDDVTTFFVVAVPLDQPVRVDNRQPRHWEADDVLLDRLRHEVLSEFFASHLVSRSDAEICEIAAMQETQQGRALLKTELGRVYPWRNSRTQRARDLACRLDALSGANREAQEIFERYEAA